MKTTKNGMEHQSLEELEDEVREIIDDEIDDMESRLEDDEKVLRSDIEDILHEIVDGTTPIHTSEIMEIAKNNIEITRQEVDSGLVRENTPEVISKMAIYEHLLGVAYKWLDENEQRFERV